jgi:hypothetical protein
MKKLIAVNMMWIACVVSFYAIASTVLHKTADPVFYRTSANTPDYDSETYFINPDVDAVAAVPTKYWARPLTDPVTEMSQGEKDTVDASIAAAVTQSNRTFAIGGVDDTTAGGVRTRALIELLNKRDNFLVNRIAELQAAMDAMKASSGAADNLRAAIPASWLATGTRTKADAIVDYKADINAGNQDTP